MHLLIPMWRLSLTLHLSFTNDVWYGVVWYGMVYVQGAMATKFSFPSLKKVYGEIQIYSNEDLKTVNTLLSLMPPSKVHHWGIVSHQSAVIATC